MKTQLSLKKIILPFIVLAFVGVAVTFLSPFFTTTTRWLVLALVMVYVVATGRIWKPLRTGFALITIIYGVWCIATVLWSESPMLSAMKSGAFFMVSLTCLVVGYYWALQPRPEKMLDFLLPLTIAALLAGVLGRFSTQATVYTGASALYQGLVGGPNMFGSMLAMCSPFIMWMVYYKWPRLKPRIFWVVVAAIAAYYLLAASSRGAILVVLITMLGMFLSLSLGRRLQIIILSVGLVSNFFMVLPDQFEVIQQKFLYKHATRAQGVFYTRQDVWHISYERARDGGWFGGGYGVSIGDHREFAGGLTVEGYGREKGNTQLAIVEETGLIGLALYAASLVALFARLVIAVRLWPTGPGRIMMAIITAVLAGMVVGSFFEAWWVAPGAPESVYFWAMAGVALGYSSTRPVLASQNANAASLRRGTMLGSRHGQGPAAA